jgi:outer membrane receptor protein involved in Fe transport
MEMHASRFVTDVKPDTKLKATTPSLLRRALALVLTSLAFTFTLSAQEPKRTFDVPAGDAEQTLKQFATQAQREIVFSPDNVAGLKTNSVQGEYAPQVALDQMLADTGLTATQDAKTGAFAVRRGLLPNGPRAVLSSDRPANKSKFEDGAVVLDEYQITGSRMDGLINKGVIPTTEDSPIYFDVIDRIEIERMGATNIEEVLRNSNQITTYSTANQEASVVQIVGPGSLASNVSMRGLDALQTVVLINGRRIARASFPNLVGNASGDLSRIPISAIERIEIMPMSGSAMFGGGAIGGVINVILRKNYSGREITTKYSTSTEGGGSEFTMSYLHGFSLNDGRTSGTFTINYRNRGPLSFYDRQNLLNRALERLPVETAISNFTQMPGMIRLSAAAGELGIPGAPGVRYAAVPVGLSPAQANALKPADFAATAGQFTPSFERYKSNYLYTPSEALSINFSGEHQLVPEHLTLYGEFGFNTNRQDIENPKFFGAGTSYTMAATHPFNPFRTGVTPGFVGRAVVLNVLMTDARRNLTEMQRDSYRGVLGLKGKFGDKWEWTLDGTSEVTVINGDSQVGADNINLATFFSTSTALNTTLAQRWGIYNLLADHNVYPIDPSVNEDYFNSVAQQRYWQYASNLIARVSGDAYDWRAGTIRTSLGAEAYWWQYEGKRPAKSPQTLIDLLGANNAPRSIAFTKQGRRTDSLFGEITIPVLSQKWRPLPVESLDLNLSARHESTNDSKASQTIAAAARLALTKDIALRASYTEGFFPPEQSALHIQDYAFSTLITTNVSVIDPRRGNITQTYAVTNTAGPNPDLRPETSTSENFGVILTPRVLPGLRVNVDFWRIQKIDAIRTPTATQLIQNEEFFSERVIRGPNLPSDPAGWAGPVTSFDTRAINISSFKTNGFDLQVSYKLKAGDIGDFNFSTNATYTDTVITRITPTSAVTETVGTREGALVWRGRGSAFWERNNWRGGVTGRYTDSYVTATTAPSLQFPTASGIDGPKIASELVWDVQVGYRIPYSNQASGWRSFVSGTDWSIGALNVFNKMPPWFSTGFYSRYSDPRMRYVYLQVKKSL